MRPTEAELDLAELIAKPDDYDLAITPRPWHAAVIAGRVELSDLPRAPIPPRRSRPEAYEGGGHHRCYLPRFAPETVVTRRGSISVLDDERAFTCSVPAGALLNVAHGEVVDRGRVLAVWPSSWQEIPAPVAGALRFDGLVEGRSLAPPQHDPYTGRRCAPCVIGGSGLAPTIGVGAWSRRMEPGARILVREGMRVEAGEILAFIHGAEDGWCLPVPERLLPNPRAWARDLCARIEAGGCGLADAASLVKCLGDGSLDEVVTGLSGPMRAAIRAISAVEPASIWPEGERYLWAPPRFVFGSAGGRAFYDPRVSRAERIGIERFRRGRRIVEALGMG